MLVVSIILAGGYIVLFCVLHFEVFGLEVGSGEFPTPFRRVVRFVASQTFWILLLGILPFVAFLLLLSFEFPAVFLDVPGFCAIVAGDIWVNAQKKNASSLSCCCRGSGHCGYRNVVTSLKSFTLEFSLQMGNNFLV